MYLQYKENLCIYNVFMYIQYILGLVQYSKAGSFYRIFVEECFQQLLQDVPIALCKRL